MVNRPGSQPDNRGSIPRRLTNCLRLRIGARRYERCSGCSTHPVGSIIQRVGESGRPYLTWNQGIGSSNLPTLTIFIPASSNGRTRHFECRYRGSNP